MYFLVFIFLLFFGCQKISIPRDAFGKFFGVVTMRSNDYFSMNGFINEGDTLYVGFKTSNTPILQFFIADEDNFNKWKNGEDAQFLVSYNNISELDEKFSIRIPANYYIVIVNGSQKQRVFIRIKRI